MSSSLGLSRRNIQPPLVEPNYEFQDIPRCMKDLSTSVIAKIDNRDIWLRCLAELLLLCNEAGTRNALYGKERVDKLIREAKEKGLPEPEIPASLTPIHKGKPLSLEYLADRVDLDDPLYGYMIRTANEGWLQGFVTLTTFTTWQRWFRWDTLADEAGVLHFQDNGVGLEALVMMGIVDPKDLDSRDTNWWLDRKIEGDGFLSACLNAEIRDGDPNSEGIIWPHVAELSLLGGIGCGSYLLSKLLEELEMDESSPYHYVVLQATENSVPFYESHGFVRIGAVARYFDKTDIKNSPKANGNSRHGKTSSTRASSHFTMHTVDIANTKTWADVASLTCVPVFDVLFMNKHTYEGIKEDTPVYQGQQIRIPSYPSWIDPLHHIAQDPNVVNARDTLNWVKSEAKLGEECPTGMWYLADENETPLRVAKKVGVDAGDLCDANRETYEEISVYSALREYTLLRLPGRFPENKIPSSELQKKHKGEINRFRLDWGWGSDDSNKEGLGEVTTYRHWAFSDDPIVSSVASYMMVRPLRRTGKTTSKCIPVKALPDNTIPSWYPYHTTSFSEASMNGINENSIKAANTTGYPKTVGVSVKCDEAVSGPLKASAKLIDLECFDDTHGVKRPKRGETTSERLNRLTVIPDDSQQSFLNVFIRHGSTFGPPMKAMINRPVGVRSSREFTQPTPYLNAFEQFCSEREFTPKSQLEDMWRNLGDVFRGKYEIAALADKVRYEKELMVYSLKLTPDAIGKYLVNKVVKLAKKNSFEHRQKFMKSPENGHEDLATYMKSRQLRKDEDWEYYFVYTYISDLYWCRLCPMQRAGEFTDPKYFKRLGKPRWVLVPEGTSDEIDVSASRCIPIKSAAVKGCKDADNEEWEIFDN